MEERKENEELGEEPMEDVYLLMMEALDGELNEEQAEDLARYLQDPDYAQEWEALQAMDSMFTASPLLAPPPDFAQRTLAALPNRRLRVWVTSVVYLLLFISGLLPLVLGGLTFLVFQTNATGGFLSVLTQLTGVAGTVLSALWLGLSELVTQQPMVIGWSLVMLGTIYLWGGVFRRVVLQPQLT